MKTFFMSASLIAVVIVAGSCRLRSPQDAGSNRSKVTSVTMTVPAKDSKGTAFTVEGYSIQIVKDVEACTFKNIDSTNKITASEGSISESLKQDCDYTVKLSFGKLAVDGKTLEAIYLTNDAHDGQEAKLASIKKEDLKGKAAISIKACVSVTKAGAEALKIAAGECVSVTDNSSDVAIDVEIGAQPVTPGQIEAPKVGELAVDSDAPDTVKTPLAESKAAMAASVKAWNDETAVPKSKIAACKSLLAASESLKSALKVETADFLKVPAPTYTVTFAPIEKSYRDAVSTLNKTFACEIAGF